MKCNYCGAENAEIKKTCSECHIILSGWVLHNTTGEIGYRISTGVFFPYNQAKDMFPVDPERIEFLKYLV